MDAIDWNPIFPSKYDRASIMSRICYDWARKIIWGTYKGRNVDVFTEDAPKELKAKTQRELMTRNANTKVNSRNKLLSTLSRLYLCDCLIVSFFSLMRFCIMMLIQNYFMGLLLASFHSSESDKFWLHRYVSSAVIIIASLVSWLSTAYSALMTEKLGAKIRIIASSSVYEKLLRIPMAEMKKINIGHIINLFASDVSKFDDCAKLICSRLLDPLAVVASIVYLQLMIGTPSVIGYVILIIIGISMTCFISIFKKFGRERAILTDQRLKLTTDMITETKTMKMFCWEEIYCKSISEIRKKEMWLTFLKFCCKSVISLFQTTTARIAIYITLILMIFMGQTITVGNVYMSYAILNQTLITLVILFARLVEAAAYALVSFERIQDILDIKETENSRINKELRPPTLVDVTSSWHSFNDDNSTNTIVFQSVNLSFPYQMITMVTGPVGSGKSSLLLTVANELFIHSGSVFTGGSLTYLPQEPWLFPSTIKQNILFGLPFDEQKYQLILASCALDQDLSQFPNGDSSSVDDKGLTLSGGQKSRIALARALYRDCDVYLLDDPLSAVDVKVGKHIWKNCFESSGKTIILVSHAVHLLSDENFVVNLFEKRILCGIFGELKKFMHLPTISDSVDANVEEQNAVSLRPAETNNSSNALTSKEIVKENICHPKSNSNLILLWCQMAWNFANGYGTIVLILLLSIIGQAFSTAFDILLSMWVYSQNEHQTNLFYLGFLLLGESVFTIARNLVLFLLSIRSSLKLHQKMIHAVTKTNMNFFNKHQTGQIINRFSKDVEYVDDYIPTSAAFQSRLVLHLLGIVANAVYSNFVVSVPIVIFFFVLGMCAKLYKKPSNYYNKIEASARSPIYSYMNCTLNGITVIRSHEVQEKLTQEFDTRLDRHSSIWTVTKGIGYWMTIVSDLIGVTLIASVVILTDIFPNFSNSSRLGVGISSTIIVGGLLSVLVKETVDIDTLFVSIERMVEYIHLHPEEDNSKSKLSVSQDWPKDGHIRVTNLSLYYSKDKKALDNVSFEIYPKEKIGIVGRTGAGKSSLIAALFQMAEIDGQIQIDGTDITTLNLSEYRKKLSIIPQNPVLLSGSIRRNLDPTNEFFDDVLWNVLEDVQLKDVVTNLPKGLEDGMDHFSVGQKQLFCLARTMLYKRKIIIFDEATSNIDNKTDEMMQELIRAKFSNSTLLVIAHRLQTVVDLDRIMVLHQGKIVEFDSPTVLLNNPDSMFRQMILNAKINLTS